MTPPAWRAILWDLDGTLVDTAPDLAGAVQDLCRRHGRQVPDYAGLRQTASHGAPGLLGRAFGFSPGDPEYARLREEFLELYVLRQHRESRLFPGIPEILEETARRGIPWGIVTNKPGHLTRSLLATLRFPVPPAVVISGDTTARAKPDPMPVRAALETLSLNAETVPFIGDDRRDIRAGQAAGCPSWAAAWGYCGEGTPVGEWGADRILYRAEDLAALLALPQAEGPAAG